MFPSLSCLLGKVGTRPGPRLIAHHNSLTLLTTQNTLSYPARTLSITTTWSQIFADMSSHYSGSSSVSEFKQVQEELSKSPGFAREQEIVWSQATQHQAYITTSQAYVTITHIALLCQYTRHCS